jgi:hypothetical protein
MNYDTTPSVWGTVLSIVVVLGMQGLGWLRSGVSMPRDGHRGLPRTLFGRPFEAWTDVELTAVQPRRPTSPRRLDTDLRGVQTVGVGSAVVVPDEDATGGQDVERTVAAAVGMASDDLVPLADGGHVGYIEPDPSVSSMTDIERGYTDPDLSQWSEALAKFKVVGKRSKSRVSYVPIHGFKALSLSGSYGTAVTVPVAA